jgi:hypothetical protein
MKSFRTLAVLALALGMAIMGGAPVAASTFTIYRSAEDAELLPSLPINGGKKTVFALALFDAKTGGLNIGDELIVLSKLQVTNNNSKEAMVDEQVWVCPSSTVTIDPTTNAPSGGCISVDHNNSTNCTPTQHHCGINGDGFLPITAAMTTPYAVYVTQSAWSYSPMSGAIIQVNLGNGNIQALKIRP